MANRNNRASRLNKMKREFWEKAYAVRKGNAEMNAQAGEVWAFDEDAGSRDILEDCGVTIPYKPVLYKLLQRTTDYDGLPSPCTWKARNMETNRIKKVDVSNFIHKDAWKKV